VSASYGAVVVPIFYLVAAGFVCQHALNGSISVVLSNLTITVYGFFRVGKIRETYVSEEKKTFSVLWGMSTKLHKTPEGFSEVIKNSRIIT
jgi:hypothetical protein